MDEKILCVEDAPTQKYVQYEHEGALYMLPTALAEQIAMGGVEAFADEVTCTASERLVYARDPAAALAAAFHAALTERGIHHAVKDSARVLLG